jgi:hypothetical protein
MIADTLYLTDLIMRSYWRIFRIMSYLIFHVKSYGQSAQTLWSQGKKKNTLDTNGAYIKSITLWMELLFKLSTIRALRCLEGIERWYLPRHLPSLNPAHPGELPKCCHIGKICPPPVIFTSPARNTSKRHPPQNWNWNDYPWLSTFSFTYSWKTIDGDSFMCLVLNKSN